MNKFKGFMHEFKEFAMRGNVINLAVGVIIGAAFQSIVTSLTENIINPLIGLLFQANLDNVGLTLNFGEKTVFFGFGAFIASIINFIIMAFVIFCLVKMINKLASLGKHDEPAAAPTTKICPYCKSEIAIDAVKCPHCVSDLSEEE